MSGLEFHQVIDESRQRVAAEVVELGEALFDAVIDAVASHQTTADASDEPFPTEDLRAAADEFFRALRVLLGIERGAT
jgi:hypothetical protein